MHIEIKTGNYQDEFVKAVAQHVADLNLALRSLEDGSFIVSALKTNPQGVFQIQYAGINTADNAEQRHIIKCFAAVIKDFITFLDKMVAIKIIGEQGVSTKEPLIGEAVVIEYVTNYVNNKIQEVARDTSLTNPKKIDHFYGLGVDTKNALNGYFAIRRAFEHHSGIPDTNIEFTTLPLKFFDGKTEITKLPYHFENSGAIMAQIVKETKALKKGEKISLTEDDLRKAIFTMAQVATSEIVTIVHNGMKKDKEVS